MHQPATQEQARALIIAVASPIPVTQPAHGAGRRILRAAVSVTAAGVVVKLAAMFKEIVVASVYGRSDAMDAFLAAFLIPGLLINLIAESMNQALIPTLIRVRLEQGHARAQQLLSSSMLATLGMLIGVSLAMAALARLFFPLIGSNFSPLKLDLAIHLFYALLPCVVLGGIASNCTAVLNTLGRFTWPALTPLILSACVVFSTLTLRNSLGVWALAVATVAGGALQAGALATGMHASGYAFRLRWTRPR